MKKACYNLSMKLIVDSVTSNEYKDDLTISELLDYLKVEPVPWLVVAVNEVFYKPHSFSDVRLHDSDMVDLIYIRGGG